MNKKKTTEKRLELNKETVRMLAEPQMAEVYGGLWTCGCSDNCTAGCQPYSAVCSGPICNQAHIIR